MATRTGISTLRKLLRELCKLAVKFPGILTSADVPTEIKAALIALIGVCLVNDFENAGAGEIHSGDVI